MKIIDVGTVIDILDPQGIGRIRYFSFDDNIATKQRAYTGPAWDKSDPTVALPFLPTHINIIPEIKGAVKIIKHIAETDGLTNQEYIPGPFTTSHDFSYAGAGVNFLALPLNQGGVGETKVALRVVEEDGGRVFHTSGDETGDFYAGNDFIIRQESGTIEGRTFNKAISAQITPLNLALEG
jgi:hypothetical protein